MSPERYKQLKESGIYEKESKMLLELNGLFVQYIKLSGQAREIRKKIESYE